MPWLTRGEKLVTRYANEDIDRFTVADTLAAFGLPAPARGPCPLCLTSKDSTAFSQTGRVWKCFACGRGGTAVRLYAALGGVSVGAAIHAIAGHLELTEQDPTRAAATREAALAARDAKDKADRLARMRWQLAFSWRDLLRREIASIPDTPLGWDVLANLYRQLGTVEAWIEQASYPTRGWS